MKWRRNSNLNGQVKRSFDILCGDNALATDLDFFVAAGGVDKVLRIRGDIDFAGDAVHGPLTVRFVAKLGLAQSWTFEVRDANGATVAYMRLRISLPGLTGFAGPTARRMPCVVERSQSAFGNAGQGSG